MIEVEVLYSDLSRQRVPIEQIGVLPKFNVLAIVVSTDQEAGKLKNIAHISGFDTYALCQQELNSQPWIMLTGWDDDGFIWRRTSNPHDNEARIQVDAPLGCMNVIFRGLSVTPVKWAEAERIFEKEML